MKPWNPLPIAWATVSGLLLLSGCTGGPAVIKERGVYTTLAMEGQQLDLPASGYISRKTFGPGQNPVAIVVGYGFRDGRNNHPQPFDLEVVELASGTVVLNRSGAAFPDRAAIMELPLRKRGNYRVKLILNDAVRDTWDFTVSRDTAAADTQGRDAPALYARGIFGVGIEPAASGDAFVEYDNCLSHALLEAVRKETLGSARELFAQVTPGEVVIQFQLGDKGTVSSPRILSNSLTGPVGEFFLRALQHGAPYAAWPKEALALQGSGTRTVKVTFSCD